MKKSALVLSIVSAILTVFAVVFLILTPTIMKEFSYMVATTTGENGWQVFTKNVFGNWADFHKLAFDGTFIKLYPVVLYLMIGLGVLVLVWIVHLVFLIVRKRANAIPVNVIYLICGLVSWDLLFIALCPNYFTGDANQNVFQIISSKTVLKDGVGTPIQSGMKTLGFLPYILGALALGLLLASIIISIIDVIKYPGLSRKSLQIKPASMVGATADSDIENPVFIADPEATAKASNDSEIRNVLNSELTQDQSPDGASKAAGVQAVVDPTVPAKTTINKDSYSGGTPTIVQYISYGAVNNNNGPVPPVPPLDRKPSEKEDIPMTDEQLRRIISEELDKKAAPKVEKAAPAPAPAPKAEPEADVLTSDDLRAIIREEMKKAGKAPAQEPLPTKDNEPLTSDDLRAIIAQELKASDEPAPKKEEEPVITYDDDAEPEAETLTSDDLRAIIQEELAKNNVKKDEKVEPQPVEEKPAPAAKVCECCAEEGKPDEATVVSEDDLVTTDDLRAIIKDELSKALAPIETAKVEPEEKPAEPEVKPAPEPVAETPKAEEVVTTDDLRAIIRQELDASKVEEPAPAPIEEEEPEAKPLTADELRNLIQEALDEHDNPERRHLTEDEARDLIVEQIRSYYLGKQKDAEALEKAEQDEARAKKEAEEKALAEQKAKEEAAKKAEEDKKAKEEADRRAEEEALAKKKADEEAAEAEKRRQEEEAAKPQPLTGDELRAIIREEVKANVPAPAPVVEPAPAKIDADEIKNAISEELIKFREEQKAATEKAAQDEADSQMIAQARAEAQAEESKAQSEDIKNLKANSLTPEQIRTIIAEELDKKLAEKTIVQEKEPEPVVAPEPVKEEPKPEPIPEPAPAPVVTQPNPQTIVINVPPVAPAPAPAPKKVAPAPVVPAEPAPKIIRIPFPDRLVKGDKEMKSNYNELKSECLSYGLKSRLSNSGDTFRLHTKTYIKITIAGKGLKLYFALNPKDYANSPIPLHDAGGKNVYKEIPGVFKVKSALSLKRAKQLIADACEKDNLEQGKIEAHNWSGELKDYKPQIGAKDED